MQFGFSFGVYVNQPLIYYVIFGFILYILDFSLTVKAATFIFIFGRGSAILSAKQGKSGFI